MSDRVRLGDHVELITGNPFKSSDYIDSPDGIRLLRGDNVAQGRIRWDNSKYWPSRDIVSYQRYQLHAGDVILAMDRPWIDAGLKYAELRQEDVPSLLVQRVACMRAFPTLDQRFLAYLIGSPAFTAYILGVQTGTAVPHVSGRQIQDFEFILPDMGQQKAIGALLGSLDDKIAANDRIAETARPLARAHFRAMQESDDPEDVDLAAVVEFLNRGVAPRYTEDRSQLCVLNQKCIRDGRVNLASSRRTITDKVPSAKMLKTHDVLVNSTGMGTLGRVARWTGQESCTVDSHVTIVRFDPAKIDPICAGFAMLDTEAEIESLGQGSTGQTELGRTQLSGLRITVPSKERAASLRPVLNALENRGDSALEESLSLAQLRNVLLPRLMSGEIRVRDAEKVVEDVT